MAKGYWLLHIDVDDPEAYRTYQEFVRPFLAANGGRFIIRAGQQNVVEGEMRPRTALVEFESFAVAERLYNSPEYQQGRQSRLTASRADFAIIEGFDG